MLEDRDQKPGPARTPPLFADFSRRRKAMAVIAFPVIFGILALVALRWSAVAWWTWQALGILGAVAAGFEHRHLRGAAARGAAAGLIAAVTIVCGHALVAGEDAAAFDPTAFPVFATAASAALHAGGAVLRRRSEADPASQPAR